MDFQLFSFYWTLFPPVQAEPPFELSLSKPVAPQAMPFDKLRANGISSLAHFCQVIILTCWKQASSFCLWRENFVPTKF
jgi:hypothetical protein